MQTIAVILFFVVAAWYLYRRIANTFKNDGTSSCGCAGCDGCSPPAHKAPDKGISNDKK